MFSTARGDRAQERTLHHDRKQPSRNADAIPRDLAGGSEQHAAVARQDRSRHHHDLGADHSEEDRARVPREESTS